MAVDGAGVYSFPMTEERKREIGLAVLKQLLTDEVNSDTQDRLRRLFCDPGRLMCLEWQSPGLGLSQPDVMLFFDTLAEEIKENQHRRVGRNP